MKTIAYVLTTALLFGAVSLPAQAGTLTIHNKNCHKQVGLDRRPHVTVHVYGPMGSGCTDKKLLVNKRRSRTMTLDESYRAKGGRFKTCRYKHEATGTVFGARDVSGEEDSSVTCKKDRAGVCQCTKDAQEQ